jgi:hypothetical protein
LARGVLNEPRELTELRDPEVSGVPEGRDFELLGVIQHSCKPRK